MTNALIHVDYKIKFAEQKACVTNWKYGVWDVWAFTMHKNKIKKSSYHSFCHVNFEQAFFQSAACKSSKFMEVQWIALLCVCFLVASVPALSRFSCLRPKKSRRMSFLLSVLCTFCRAFILFNPVTVCNAEWSFQPPELLLSLFVCSGKGWRLYKRFCSTLASVINSLHVIAHAVLSKHVLPLLLPFSSALWKGSLFLRNLLFPLWLSFRRDFFS